MGEDVQTGNVYWTRYTKAELRAAWNSDAQGHVSALARGWGCVVAWCHDEEQALIWTALFCRRFNCPSCVHRDGRTISFNCLEAGCGYPDLKMYVERMVERGPLFAEG